MSTTLYVSFENNDTLVNTTCSVCGSKSALIVNSLVWFKNFGSSHKYPTIGNHISGYALIVP